MRIAVLPRTAFGIRSTQRGTSGRVPSDAGEAVPRNSFARQQVCGLPEVW